MTFGRSSILCLHEPMNNAIAKAKNIEICNIDEITQKVFADYNMVNFTTTRKFKVTIPTFKLSAPFALN